ncbi:MAG: SBBP repeat-containing protein [Bacteroidia bacterium]|nr:SBBP repeat-containing protein [Bacteroidia bacterium]
MRFKFFILTLFLVINHSLVGQAPAWEWAQSIGSVSNDWVSNIVADSNENVYIAGKMGASDSITFFPESFIAKYSSSGNILWIQNVYYNIGSGYNGFSFVQKNNNLFFTGNYYEDTLIFNNDTLIGQGIYISKYDIDGNFIWIKSVGAISGGSISSLKINSDNAGNLYIIGNYLSLYSDTLTIGSVVLTSQTQPYIIFIAKYDSSGNPLWVKSIIGNGGNTETEVTNFSIDTYNNVYITGDFQSFSISFDSINLTNSGYSDIYIAQYNSSGNVLWDSQNFFIAKYNSSRNVLWAKNVVGISTGTSISIDIFDNTYISGWFGSSQIIFDSITLTNSGLFIVKYNSSGNVI